MRAGLTVLVMCLSVSTLSASEGPPVSIEARASGAGSIVLATVMDLSSRFEVNEFGDRLIVTDATLRVEETWKGSPRASRVVTVEGGTVGDLMLEVSDMPTLRPGERAVFFLHESPAWGDRLHGRGLGVIKLDAANRAQGTTLTVQEIRNRARAARP